MTSEKIHCNKCGGDRSHVLKSTHKTSGSEEVNGGRNSIDWLDLYEALECGGCGEVTFRHRNYFSERAWGPDESGWVETFYPPRLSRAYPPWIEDLDEDLKTVLLQTYQAIHGDMLILAYHGARTAIDMVMTSLVGDVGGFDQKLKKMVAVNHIDDTERTLFDAVVESGNAAAHRGFQPGAQILSKVMDILEAVIARKIVYPRQKTELVAEATKILSAVPKRVKVPDPGARPVAAPPTVSQPAGAPPGTGTGAVGPP